MNKLIRALPVIIAILVISLVFTIPKALEKPTIQESDKIYETTTQTPTSQDDLVQSDEDVTVTVVSDKSVTNKPETLGVTSEVVNTTSNSPSEVTPSTQTPTPIAEVVNKIEVSVTTNIGANFTIQIDEGRSHCDVLNQAVSEGKLTSINMNYHESLGSYGVYQINGVGKEDQVWWTYKVNGTSPPYGCSQVKVKNGDQVLWEYQGK